MDVRHHSTVREGLMTGAIGGLLLAAWYLATDAVSGRLLHTPNVLGQLVLAGDTTPVAREVAGGAVAGYTLLHFGIFLAAGVLLAWLIHLAVRHPTWRFGVLIGVVLGLGMAEVFIFMAPPVMRDASLRWSVALGTVVAVLTMCMYLWRRHPGLRAQVRDTPLGDEVATPPHPPGSPRV